MRTMSETQRTVLEARELAEKLASLGGDPLEKRSATVMRTGAQQTEALLQLLVDADLEFGIDRILDLSRTAVNVTNDLTVALILER